MKSSLICLGALLLCTSVASNADTVSDVSPVTTANKFVDALKHQHLRDAAAMFAPNETQDSMATERILKRIDGSLGGFSTMHPIPTLPDGKSIRLEVPPHKSVSHKIQKFFQVRYASIASDGQPVYYELNLTTDKTPPQVLSFEVHFPASDAQSTERANQLVRAITR